MPVSEEIFDIAVIGAGINGAGIAADAAGRGLKVCLLEKGDLAAGTSSASSKIIHGGLRYLENFEFGLVRKALIERENLLKAAPHIIKPLRFVLPHVDGMRPKWLLRAGLLLYDHLSLRQTLPASQSVRFSQDPSGGALVAELTRGFCYWDCSVDDARLVVLNARAAAQKGASIRTRTRVIAYEALSDELWRIDIKSEAGIGAVHARVIVNAAGPWVDQVTSLQQGLSSGSHQSWVKSVRLVKGSHIVVPRVAGAVDAYLLQARDGRVVFVLPFEDAFTLIGTTDEPFYGDPSEAECSIEERDYLLGVFHRFFVQRLSPADVIWKFSGVRPLHDDAQKDPSKATRDYRLELRNDSVTPPILTVLGGKITTYRRLAEEALDRLNSIFPNAGPAWTEGHPLPGGALQEGLGKLRHRLRQHYPNLDAALLSAVVHRHGSLSFDVLGDAKTAGDLGTLFGPGLSQREVVYLRDHEWAMAAEDVLWRRTKCGLHIDATKRATVEAAIEACL